jgi:hypothetical protein
MPSWLRNGHTKSRVSRTISIGSFGDGFHRGIIVSDMFCSCFRLSVIPALSRSRVNGDRF